MSFSAIVSKLELDTKITVFLGWVGLSGSVGESDTPDTLLTLHTNKGLAVIEVESIKAIRFDNRHG